MLESHEDAEESLANAVRSYAAANPVFTLAELKRECGKSAGPTANSLARAGELRLQAVGVYSQTIIGRGDRRVLEKMTDKTRAIAPSQEIANENAIALYNSNQTNKNLRKSNALAKFTKFLSNNPIFVRADAKKRVGGIAYELINDLIASGDVKQAFDGVYITKDIDPLSPRVLDFAHAHSRSEERLLGEISDLWELAELEPVPLHKVDISVYDKGHRLRIYLNFPDGLSIYGIAGGGNWTLWKGDLPRWKKDQNPKLKDLSDAGAEIVARRVFPEPVQFSELLVMAKGPLKPRIKKTSGTYAAIPAVENKPSTHFDYQDARLLPLQRFAETLPRCFDLFVDSREPDSIYTALRSLPNLRVFRKELEVGDYVVPDLLLIERKTSADFLNSISDSDRRLARQVHEMKKFDGKKIILVEGGIYADRQSSITLHKRLRARSHLQYALGFIVTETLGQHDTIYEILLAMRDAFEAASKVEIKTTALPKIARSNEPYDQRVAMLCAVRGISPAMAEALLLECNDMLGVAALHPTEFASIAGVSIDLAKTIYETMNGRAAPNRKPKLKVLKKA